VLITTSFSQTIQFQTAKDRNVNKPQLFTKDTTKSLFNENYIEDILSMSIDGEVEIELTKNTIFKGKVTSIHNHDPTNIMALKSYDIKDLMLIVSKVTIMPGEVIYRALLMSNDHKDILVLEKDDHDGKYYWNKKEASDLIPD
jgi:hypothetical protein